MQLTSKDEMLIEEDYENFLQEVAGDKEMRFNMNLYKTKTNKKDNKMNENIENNNENNNQLNETNEINDIDDIEDEEAIKLEELLDEMALNDSYTINDNKIFTTEEAANIPTMIIETNGFAPADVDLTSLKFI